MARKKTTVVKISKTQQDAVAKYAGQSWLPMLLTAVEHPVDLIIAADAVSDCVEQGHLSETESMSIRQVLLSLSPGASVFAGQEEELADSAKPEAWICYRKYAKEYDNTVEYGFQALDGTFFYCFLDKKTPGLPAYKHPGVSRLESKSLIPYVVEGVPGGAASGHCQATIVSYNRIDKTRIALLDKVLQSVEGKKLGITMNSYEG